MKRSEMTDEQREDYYQERAEQEHREELRAACMLAASRAYSGLGYEEVAIIASAEQFYGWVKE